MLRVEIGGHRYQFTIKDIDPEIRVWLDGVVENHIKTAYEDGKRDAMKEVKRKVKDLKDFLS
jgi:hypothetical protein